jgi:transcriptional regulator with XRE-family HTH domain
MNTGDKMRMARLAKKMSQRALAGVVGVKQQAVSEWENGGGVDPKHWPEIKEHLGIDLSTTSSITQHTPTRSPAINAQNVGSIQISADDSMSNGQQPGHYELLTDIEYEVLTLFRQYGNPTLLQRCLGQLRQAQELFR